RTESVIEVHWQGKFRGPEFAPIYFMLKRDVTSTRLKDSHGRLITTVTAFPASEHDQKTIAKNARADEDKLLKAIKDDPKASLAGLARTCGWKMKNGDPHKVKAQRTLKELEKAALVSRDRDAIIVTPKGKKALQAVTDDVTVVQFPGRDFTRLEP